MHVSFLGISGALHLDVFEQPALQVFFSNLLGSSQEFFAWFWQLKTWSRSNKRYSNPKSEYRSSKRYPMIEIQMTKTV